MEWFAVLFALTAGLLVGWRLSAGKLTASEARRAALEKENEMLHQAAEDQILQEKERERLRQLEQEKILAAKFDLMKSEFKNLSEEIFAEKSRTMQQNSHQQLETLLTPLRERMQEFKQAVDLSREKGIEQSAKLTEQIKKMMEETQRIGSEANALASALKGEQKTQGNWGEMILEDILQRSGLQAGIHYETQATLRDEDGRTVRTLENKMLRPDVIIHYPDGKDVIVDSKVSLTAFADYMNAENEESREEALSRHLKSFRAHVEELVKKDYAAHLQKNGRETVNFVLMFVPGEAPGQLAFAAQPTLWREAFDRKVVITGPTNLMTLLQLIHIAWQKADQEKNQQEILKYANQLLDRLYAFYEDFDEIGQRLTKVEEAYNNAGKRLKKSPNGHSIVSSGEKLRSLGVKLTKERPVPKRLSDASEEAE